MHVIHGATLQHLLDALDQSARYAVELIQQLFVREMSDKDVNRCRFDPSYYFDGRFRSVSFPKTRPS
jgi:hypothetical protein